MIISAFFQKLSIKRKIIFCTYGIIILISLILGFNSYRIAKEFVTNKVSISNLGMISQINSNVDFLQKQIYDSSTQLALDSNVQNYLKQSNSEIYLDHTINSTLIASKSYISVTMLYALNDNIIPYFRSNDGSNGMSSFADIEKSSIYKMILEQKGKSVWFPLEGKNQVFIENNKYPKIAMARIVRDIANYNNIGLLAICINEKTIQNIYADNLRATKNSIAIVDGSNNIISQSGPAFYKSAEINQDFVRETAGKSQGSLVADVSGRKMLITYSSNNLAGWKLYYAEPMANLTKEANLIGLSTLVIIVVCLFAIFPLLSAFSSAITAPVKKLLKSMKSFQEGNFDESVKINSSDEIGLLQGGYNNMVANIKELISKVYILQIKEKEAELDALQSQINPHFLYNTLDTVYWKAKSHNETEIADMIYSLSTMFRLSLNRGKELTTVSNEKELIEHYLLLQKVRFKNKLSYEISISPDILSYTIPKLILQPFVENAIHHGLEKKKEGGTVSISGTKEGEQLRFIISDDGVGISKEKMESIFNSDAASIKKTPAPSGGYAISNVNERLKLMFEDNYSLEFTGEPGKGMVVEMSIPAMTSKDKEA